MTDPANATLGSSPDSDAIRCDACPVLCYIKPGRSGSCDRYANHDGRLVRVDPQDLKLLDRSRVYAYVDMGNRPKGKYLENLQVKLPENIGFVKVVPNQVHLTLY